MRLFRNLRNQSGQGMTEYIIIVALIAIAAIAAFTYFGKAVRTQTAVMTDDLAGQDPATAKGKLSGIKTDADKETGDKDLKSYMDKGK